MAKENEEYYMDPWGFTKRKGYLNTTPVWLHDPKIGKMQSKLIKEGLSPDELIKYQEMQFTALEK